MKIALLARVCLCSFPFLAAIGCSGGQTPIGVDCSAHVACGLETRCGTGQECISIPGCGSAICIDATQACEESCGEPNCAILESYPAQIACSNGKVTPGRNGGGTGGAAGTGGSSGVGGGTSTSCSALQAAYASELSSVQSCSADADCGQPITGTSCGCTRNLVARSDADLDKLQALLAELQASECDSGLISTCDCPAADGFACVSGRCAWNYVGRE